MTGQSGPLNQFDTFCTDGGLILAATRYGIK